MMPLACPQCGDPAGFSKKRGQYFCTECELAFGGEAEAATRPAPQTDSVNTLKLFLSYGRDEHADEARALRDALRTRGHEVWFDEEQLGTGLDWEQRIEKGLQWCDRVVLTMTPHSVRRPDGYCLNEIAKALEFRKLIIPVLLVEVPQGAPTSICRIQYLDWRDAVPAAEKADRFLRRLARLCEAIEEDKLDFEGGQQRLIRHLQPLNFDGDLQRHVASFKGRVQLEARLRQWLRNPAGSQVLWLTAAPGLGKSAVAATLSHRWAEVAAVHFCVAGQKDKANPARAVLSIAYQLSQRQHMNLYASRLSNLDLEREAHKDARTLFDTLLVGPLAKNFPAPPEPLLVIMDGLDEATQPEGENPLAEIIAADWGRLPAWLRLMVSSRPEAELVTWLSGTQRIDIRSDDAEQQVDLADFLRERLAAIGRPPGEETLSRILSRSEGAFHYAVLLLEEVRQGRCNPDNPVDLPAGLNSFYAQTFKRRFPDITVYRGQTRPLLELILAATEPVPLAVLAGATNREAQDVRQDLSALGSMLAIEPGQGQTDPDWDTVRLSHASLRSWLTGLDATRQAFAGAYAAKVDTKGLAAEVLRQWEAGNDPTKDVQDAAIDRKGFVVRELWTLLKGAKDIAALDRAAIDLSLYWAKRQLALAIEPGEFAAEGAWRSFEAGVHGAKSLEHGGECLVHLGQLQSSIGQSTQALRAFRRALVIRERLAAQDPDNAGWQRHLAANYNRIGDVLQSQGRLAGGLEEFRKGLAIAERLAAKDPDDTWWQRELSVSYGRIGGVLLSQGNLIAALEEFRKTLAIGERLVAQDPDNAGWQSDLGARYNHIGAVLQSQGNLAGALEEFRKHLAIAERLAAQDPDNAGWQRELRVSYGRIGGVLLSQGNLAGALEEFRKTLAIAERMAAQDPDNAGWQSDLAVAYIRIGDVLQSQGNLSGALEEFRKTLAIAERLAAQDPDNVGWQSDLAVTYNRIGGVLQSQGNLAGALEEFRKTLAIAERMAAQDPDNAGWQSDLATSYVWVGIVLESQGNLAGALEEFRKDLAIVERLAAQDPDNAGWQRELSVSRTRIGDVLESQGVGDDRRPSHFGG
jgi:tetratricopeptide (TPR) repeat protein